jgi:hypothetical protein
MDFQSDNDAPSRSAPENQPIPAPAHPVSKPMSTPVSTPAPFDDMFSSLPSTRPIQRPTESDRPVINPAITPTARPQKPKKAWLKPAIWGTAVVIVAAITGYLTYSSQHSKVVNQYAQIVAFNKTISTQLQQITLLQETVPTLVPIASSYNNWTSYTLKNEKAAFQYPKTWKLVDSSTKNSDDVSVTSPNNFVITITTGSIAPTSVPSSAKLIGYAPINFTGKFGYFDFVSTANDGLVEEAMLSQAALNYHSSFPSVTQGQNSSTTGNFNVTAGYSSVNGTGESQTIANADKDASYQSAQLLIESIEYSH